MRSLLALLALTGPPSAPPVDGLQDAPPRPTRVALADGRTWVGTERGLYRLEAGDYSLALAHEEVRDLQASDEGLWVATARALYFAGPDGELSRVALGVGARPRAVAVDSARRVWAASDAGLFVREPDGTTFVRASGLPPGPVESVRTGPSSVLASTRGIVWQEREGTFAPLLRSLDDGWWELRAVAEDGPDLWLLVPQGLWRLADHDGVRTELGLGELRDLLEGSDRLYLASERGVFTLARGEIERGAPRLLLDREALDLVAAPGGEPLALTRQGLMRLEDPSALDALPGLPPPAADPERGFRALLASEPAIELVQRAVLGYLELAPARMRDLEARARRVALWPELRFGVGYDLERGSERDRDAVLSSGVIHDLFDSSRQRDRGLDLALNFEWQLSELAAPDHALAISKERRELIELRDQVLERVNRLYFERRRVLARIAELPPAAGAERREQEIRADELAAQLDAWTGGAFQRLRHGSPPDSGRFR
jgi:hypothetical protein